MRPMGSLWTLAGHTSEFALAFDIQREQGVDSKRMVPLAIA